VAIHMLTANRIRQCQSPHYKKNGRIHNGKQHHQWKECGRQYVDCFAQYLVSDETRALIERLLVERISLRGICRAVGVTLKWLLGFLVQCFESLPDHLHVQPVRGTHDVMIQRLAGEADAMASVVQKQANKQWMWVAMDAKSRQVMAFLCRGSQPPVEESLMRMAFDMAIKHDITPYDACYAALAHHLGNSARDR
jgi:insertion element IS1 protein InsB